MSDPTRARINRAFDEELSAAPVPAGLRSLSVRAAVAAPGRRERQPVLLALVAAALVVALVATLVVGSHVLRSTPVPAGSTTPPPGRGSAAVAYDQARGVMVLFGGAGSSAAAPALGDTWTWDGKYWTQRHPAQSPAPRYYSAMAYDQARHEMLLYGGIGGRDAYNETWVWNGAGWRQEHPAHEPVFGYSWQAPVMAFDPATRTLLLAGFTTDYKPQTWSWNGSDWQQISPLPGANAGMMILDGGSRLLTVTALPGRDGRYIWQTLAWNGTAWTAVAMPFTPAVDPVLSSAYDAATRQLVVLSGGDTWTFDGARWVRQHPAVQPQSMGYMVYMPNLHEVVSWGDVLSNQDNAMYAWNGNDWRLIAASTVVPSPGGEGTGGNTFFGDMSSSAAAAKVRSVVTNTSPVLLPTYLPASIYDARVNAGVDDFSIMYRSDLRDKEIDFGIVVPNPPPGGPNARDSRVKFRNALPMKYSPAGYAEYFVYDTTAPDSQRWLIWMEKGTVTNPSFSAGEVPYFLSASGFTEAEFWQVANSLR